MNRPVIEKQVRARYEGNYILQIECVSCGNFVLLKLTGKEMYELQTSDKFIQNVLPNHTPDERELFISGLCKDCYPKGEEE